MAGVTAGLIAGAAAPIIGGMIGNAASAGERGAANDAYNAALASISNLPIPDVEKQKLVLQLPELVGKYTPEEIQTIALNPSRMESLQIDPAMKSAQMAALSQLSDIGTSGLTPQDMAELNKVRRDTAQQEQARQGQIIQNLAERGMGGSGQELIARLTSSQAAADRASQESDRAASEAFQRKLAAVQQAGQLGGQIRGQEFGEQSQIAQAADAISRFNAQNQQNVGAQNVQARNEAQARNLAEQQRIAEQQAALRNQEQQYNKQLLQQDFENRYRKGAAMAGQYQAQGQQHERQAENIGQQWSQIGSGVGKIGGALLGPAGAADKLADKK